MQVLYSNFTHCKMQWRSQGNPGSHTRAILRENTLIPCMGGAAPNFVVHFVSWQPPAVSRPHPCPSATLIALP